MRLFTTLGLMAAAAATSAYGVSHALNGKPAFDPRSLRGTQAGAITQVLTLGSAHLAQMEKKPDPSQLAGLLDKLAAFKPDIITHEGLSGEQCDEISRYPARYPGVFEDYCFDTAAIEKSTGLTVSKALAQIDLTLGQWPKAPDGADRRKLAVLFLAANDRASALVQWLRLPPEERRSGDGIDQSMVELLNKAAGKSNETIAIGVALAVRLGLERVYAVDDHTADSIQGLAGDGFGPAIESLWKAKDVTPPKAVVRYLAAEKAIAETGDYLGYYRLLNLPETQRGFIDFDYGRAIKLQGSELYGRQYVAWFEARNLRMVANIRTAFGNHPGARVLNIVGASHKGYYDAYLDMMSDVQIIDAEKVLN